MSNSETSSPKPQTAFAVDMSSEAITSRLREVGELNQLGLSLAKAKLYPIPSEPTALNAIKESEHLDWTQAR